MLKKIVCAAVVAAAVSFAPATLDAQRLVSFGAMGGVTIPQGDLSELDTGFNVGLFADIGLPLLPIGVRADLTYHQMADHGHGDLQVISGTLNGKYTLLPTPVLAPYVIGGVGYYSSKIDDGHDHDRENNFGINAGVGLQFSLVGLRAFAETRFHHLFEDHGTVRLLPISIGISF
jgi:opacity protein-like surface antigen